MYNIKRNTMLRLKRSMSLPIPSLHKKEVKNHNAIMKTMLLKRSMSLIVPSLYEENIDIWNTIKSFNNVIMLEILRNGYSINDVKEKLKTPLHAAVECRNITAVRILLSKGANPFIQDRVLKQTALHTACMLVPLSKMFMIGQGYSNGKRKMCSYVYGPLEKDAEKDSIEIAKILLQSNPEIIHSTDHEHCTPLHIAAESNHLHMISILIKAGANINAIDNKGRTPIACAVIGYRLDVVKELIKYGADLHKQDENGETPLHHALEFNYSIEITEILLKNGAKINTIDKFGYSPLHVANRRLDNTFVETLISFGADVYAVDHYNCNVLHYAVLMGDTRLKTFISMGIDINSRDNNNMTPLHKAAIFPYENNVEILLSNGADVNALDDSGNTPLSITKIYRIMIKIKGWDKFIIDLISHIILESLYNERNIYIEGYRVNMQAIEEEPYYRDIKMQCEEELTQLHNIKICSGIRADIFLTANADTLSRFVNNPKIHSLCDRFKIYSKYIKKSIESAKNRYMLLVSAMTYVKELVPFQQLPDTIIWNICGYLKQQDIMALKYINDCNT
ncbi:SWPV1-302 [Shearwaterpox virus]|uniref:SWPV1-302 n=1 Tax=Shearwaterpox virus TaxID=1974596 RepID=A0A1V0S8A3_CNPV|nr:SWPV1-302 [Shearwaterpox virus]